MCVRIFSADTPLTLHLWLRKRSFFAGFSADSHESVFLVSPFASNGFRFVPPVVDCPGMPGYAPCCSTKLFACNGASALYHCIGFC